MSVLSPIISSIDGVTRRIYLKAGVSDYFPIEDIYHEYRNLRRTDETLRKFEALLKAEGNIAKGGGAFTPRYVVLLEGTKIVPFNETLQINQLGDMITDDPDNDASLYDISGLTVAKPIFIKPSEAETIQLNSSSIEYSSFQNGVWIDASTGNTGTDFPNGSREYPVNNGMDAINIANSRGFDRLYVLGNYTFTTGHNIDSFTIEGQNAAKTRVTIEAGANAALLELFEAHVTGVLDGGSTMRECLVDNLNYVNGFIHQCILNPGTIVLGGNNVAFIMDSFSGVAGESTPTIDMGGSGQGLAMRNYSGGIKLINMVGSDSVSIDLLAGQVILDNTIVSGTIVVRGNGKVIDTLGNHILTGIWNGGVNVINETPSVFHQHTLDAIKDAVWTDNIRTLTASPLSTGQDTRITEVHGQVSREIYIDTTLVTNGNGYQQSPYNNWSDAVDDAESSGITALILMADAIVDRNIKNFLITGVGLPTIDFAGFDLKGCKLIQCKLEGLFINTIIAEKCVLLNNAWLNGWYDTCAFAGLSTCVDGAEVNVIDSTSKIAGLDRPEISMNAIGTCKLSVRGQRGGLDISNCNINSDEASIEMMAGSLTLKSSCSEGQMVIRGIGTWVNEGTTVGRLFEMVRGDHVTEIHQANFNKRSWDKLNNTIAIYDDDNTTVLHTFDTNSDLSNITPQ